MTTAVSGTSSHYQRSACQPDRGRSGSACYGKMLVPRPSRIEAVRGRIAAGATLTVPLLPRALIKASGVTFEASAP